MRINGEPCEIGLPLTVLGLLEARGLDPRRVAVERNGEIVPRAQFAQAMLTQQDQLEIVAFVGGG